MTSASLWAAVPHYVAAVPNPKAALALIRRLEGLTGIAVDASELELETDELRGADRPRGRRQPRDQRAGRADRGRTGGAARRRGRDLPSADTIARDFQHFLRQQGK